MKLAYCERSYLSLQILLSLYDYWTDTFKMIVLLSSKKKTKNNSMEQSSWEAKSSSATQIPHIWWNLNFYDCVYKSLPYVHILNHKK
jgi:hypothetical protein